VKLPNILQRGVVTATPNPPKSKNHLNPQTNITSLYVPSPCSMTYNALLSALNTEHKSYITKSIQICIYHKAFVWSVRWTGNCKKDKTGNVPITQHWDAFGQSLLPWKSNKYYIFWVRICSLRYPACNAHAPYYHLWPVRPYNIMNGTTFGGKKRCRT
jgi:hypothetical protein